VIVVGMLSGTSMDGLDTAVCEVELLDGGAARLGVLAHRDVRWPADLQERAGPEPRVALNLGGSRTSPWSPPTPRTRGTLGRQERPDPPLADTPT
jgi:hypothetical protein